jgi:hypothetical protein
VSCTPPVRSVTVAQRAPVFSSADTSPGENFIPLSPESLDALAAVLKSFRATLTVESSTVGVKVDLAWQTSEDGVTWGNGTTSGSSVKFGSTLTGVGMGPKTSTSDWIAMPTAVKRFIRWGVVVGQNAGVNTLQACVVTLDLDLESRS